MNKMFLKTTMLLSAATMASSVFAGIIPLSASAASKKVTIKLWADNSAYRSVVKDFEKNNPNINVQFQKVGSTDTIKYIQKDASTVGDVDMTTHDQLGTLVSQGLVLRTSPAYTRQVKKTQVKGAIAGATYKGKMYAYPYGVETQVLYYNKSKLSANDVKNWSTLTKKGKIAVNFGETGANYVWAPLFFTNGDVLFGKNGEQVKGTNFANQKGVDVLKWVQAQKNNAGVVQDNAGALQDLTSGKVDAFLSGPWSKADVQKALKNNYAVAKYPTIDISGKTKQLQAFLGVKIFIVNHSTKHPLQASKLASYLTSDKVQKKIFNQIGYIPSSKKIQKTASVKKDPLAKAVSVMSKTATPMPKITQINNFWTPMDAIFNDTWKGKITQTQMLSKLKTFQSQISKSTK
ncbi:extracellular solute-binding protein [Oenococcus sicerae]|uniref:Extracellular solute-binding protein n=1 Tax=Oenococcus sicerae TaxID=2203724 RepID=A0AAJ1VNG5_9LACO|nr:extracellular solute-binding protein [Oenococcus sicerae]MDN6900184.1 extracellular solute-binding protein [Oenococcus sicerae]